MGLQRKTGTGIKTQAWEPYQGGSLGFGGVGWDHVAWTREPRSFGVLPFATWLR